MDKVIVIGVFEFLGFHICSKMLEKGYEILGINDSSNDPLLVEEMQLQIGRNANFQEVMESEWDLEKLSNPSFIVADYYDFYIKNKEKTFFQEKICSQLLNNMEKIKSSHSKIIFLLPIQCLMENRNEEDDRLLSELFSVIKNEEIPILKLYLPTIYGPWQSKNFIFQKMLLNDADHKRELKVSNREWRQDAIYVKDFVRTFLDKIENNHFFEEFIMKSELKNHWEECANYLNIQINSIEVNCYHLKENDIPEIIVKAEWKASEGLEEQKRMLKPKY